MLEGLVRDAIGNIVDEAMMQEATEEQDRHRETLTLIAENFDEAEKAVRRR